MSMCVFITKDKRNASLESSAFLLPLPLTPKRIYADCSAAFFMATHSQLHFLYLWQNRSPGMEYQQSLNPAFPLENCTWIPDSLPQLQVCTLQGFPGKSKLSLKTCLTPAVRFLSPVMTLSSCALLQYQIMLYSDQLLLTFLKMHLKMLQRDLFVDTYLQPPKLWSFRWGCNHWF